MVLEDVEAVLYFFRKNCALSFAHCLGTLTACGMSFLNARLCPTHRTTFCSFDCFFRNQFFAGILAVQFWNKNFVHVAIHSPAEHNQWILPRTIPSRNFNFNSVRSHDFHHKNLLDWSDHTSKTIIHVWMCSVVFAFLNQIPENCNFKNPRSLKGYVHQSYFMKIILRPVSRGIPWPCRIYQKVYFFWVHTLRRFLVNVFFNFDELSRNRLSSCRTWLSNPTRHCSVDTELIRAVNDSE